MTSTPLHPSRLATAPAAQLWLGWRECLELGAVAGLLLALCFPAIDWDWLCWVALVPLLLICLRAASSRRALAGGYLAGVIFFGATCPWIYHAVHYYGGVPAPLAAFILGLFVLLMGAFFALFGWLGFHLARRVPVPWLTLPALWMAIEWLRTYIPFGGFPWNLIGYAGVDHAGFMLSATVGGVYAAGFLIALENAFLAWIIADLALARRTLYRTALLWPFIVWAVVVGFASFPYDPPTMVPANLRAVLVQPNASLDAAWTGASLQAYWTELARISQPAPAPAAAPPLILWPEEPAPLDYAAEPGLQQVLANLARASGGEILIGESTLLDPAAPLGAQRPVNAAQLVLPDGAPGARYDKIHLVPFGEYVPLPPWVQRLGGIRKLLVQAGDFVPGHEAVLFRYGPAPAAAADARFAALICYESIFPQLARREVARGAQWLVNLSDDGWYGRSSARPQGLEMARMRAIENRRWLLRDTNNGITAIIDPYGRVVAQLPLDRRAVLRGNFAARADTTFYTRHGDWLPLAGTIFLIVICGATGGNRRRRPRAPEPARAV